MQSSGISTSIWRTDSVDDLLLDEKAFPNIKNGDYVKITFQEQSTSLFLQTKMSSCRIGQVQLGAEASNLLQISQRVDGLVTKSDRPPIASYIEFTIKDQYFSNGDFHRFTSTCHKRVLFVGKTMNYGILKAQVRKIVVNDKEVLSAYYDADSKTIFRSKSAQVFLFLHISRELFDFCYDGDTYFEKMVSGVIPKIFNKWKEQKTNHRLTLILFSRIILTEDYSDNMKYTESLLNSSFLGLTSKDVETDFLGRPCQDFYQILSLNSKTVDHKQLSEDIRISIINFRNMILNKSNSWGAFQLAYAREGNILEAVNLAMNSHENMIGGRELYLSSTGFSVIVISSLNGILCCDKLILRVINERMLEYGTGLDIISIAPPPFSKAPVFAFLPILRQFNFNDQQQKTSTASNDPLYSDSDDMHDSGWLFYQPEWLDISYYTACTFTKSKTYLNQNSSIVIPREPYLNLKLKHFHKAYKIQDIQFKSTETNAYDESVFQESITIDNFSLPWEKSTKSPKFDLSSSYQSNISLSDGSPGSKSFKSDGLENTAIPIDIQVNKNQRIKYNDIKWAKRVQKDVQSRESSGLFGSPSKSYNKQSGFLTPSLPNSSPMMGLQRVMQNDSNSSKRWEHFYLEDEFNKYKVAQVKWSSIICPACMPVTVKSFPLKPELQSSYLEYNYSISNGGSNEGVSLVKKSISIDSTHNDGEALEEQLKNMLYIRLSEGFQLHLNPIPSAVTISNSPPDTTKIERPVVEYYKDDKSFFKSRLNPSLYSSPTQVYVIPTKNTTVERLKLTRSREVHKIAIDYPSNSIQVTRYIKQLNYDRQPILYKYSLFTQFQSFDCQTEFNYPGFDQYNWNNLDQLISGWSTDSSLKSLSFYRTRYILIPAEAPPNNLSLINPKNESLDEEELRIAGFLRFLENFVKVQYRDTNDVPVSNVKGMKKLQDSVNHLGISMTTFSAASHVKNELQKPVEDVILNNEDISSDCTKKTATIEQVARLMTDPVNGLNFKDRRWHLRFYERVFVGSDFVDFLIRTFQDITTREEAVEYGNDMFNKGLFEHVKAKHTLLDGHYFYRLSPQFHETNRDRSFGWFIRSKSNSIDSISDKTKSLLGSATKKFRISEKMMIDANKHTDADNRQLCVLHFDTIHNPKICFHFQIHWLLSSSFYVENLVHSWTRSASATGFKLVETPSEQTILLGENNPFRKPFVVRFAVAPPDAAKLEQFYVSHMPVGFFLGQLALELNYILDIESDNLFPESYKLTFSHIKTATEYSQYVHRTGACFLLFKPGNNEMKWIENPMYILIM
eukprot:NODE_259_length_12613_cov_0.311411.p1 type:complete len:1298 gc:universal NODE_259_length_12613_cov_0.311411:10943-7050(-)